MIVETSAFIVSLLAATFLVVLGVSCFVRPEGTQRFLGAFASTARLHLIEVACRLVAGAALVVNAPRMRSGGVVAVFGWMVILTSVVLAVLPWRLHQRFAAVAMPHVYPRLRIVGFVAAAGGVALLGALLLPEVGTL